MLILVGFISAVVVVLVGRPKAGTGSQAAYAAPQAQPDYQQSSTAGQTSPVNGRAMPPGMEQFVATEQDARASLGDDSVYRSAWQALYVSVK